ncbi:MAG: PmeII family type II restriction endonuclease [Anaerolineales bacterium]
MKSLNLDDVVGFVETNIGDFHKRRLENFEALKLKKILGRKNPYLFKAKNILTGPELVKTLLDAHLSSQEETIFGEFLEKLALFVCGTVYDGRKSSAEGIDLEFQKEGKLYIVSIKSGPNWGDSRQISKVRDDFKKAKRILGTSGGTREVIAINGCCYGRSSKPDKGDYFKLCGQEFWEFISGEENLYVEIIEPLGHRAKERNEEFVKAYARIINTFTAEFGQDFYTPTNEIDWQKLVKFNSGKKSGKKS